MIDYNKKIKILIEHLSSRASARVAQKVIKRSGLRTGRTLEDTIAYVECIKPDRAEVTYKKLLSSVEDFHLFGAKALRILKIKESEVENVKDFFESFVPNEDISSYKFYPKPLKESTLKKESLHEPCFIKKYISPLGTLYVFSSRNIITLRDVFEGSDIDDFGLKNNEYDKIIAIKEKDIQFFNSIFVHADYEKIELRVDLASVMGITVLKDVLDIFERKLDSLYFDKYKVPLPVGKVDLFPIIEKLYQTKDDGYVSELTFKCPTGANRTETLSSYRKDLNVKDLRLEEYHVAGTKKIDNVFIPYKICVYWDSENTQGAVSGEPELMLSGSLIMSKSNAIILDYAIVNNTLAEKEFNYVIAAIHEYV
ncbi:hypothetical protein [Erwinia tasmaniensis]|uniref:hypothetical protein n=1 Tax=Erwinia tasmaniensis TaxID=338565 RepID=UPI003A4D9A3B